jgi:hypothetical protein
MHSLGHQFDANPFGRVLPTVVVRHDCQRGEGDAQLLGQYSLNMKNATHCIRQSPIQSFFEFECQTSG